MHALRLAFRRLSHERGFALVAILTLAVGLGANTAIFSLVDSVLLRPLPYAQPQQLVALHQSIPQFVNKYPYFPDNEMSFKAWRSQSKLLSSIALLRPQNWVMTGAGEPRQVFGDQISATMLPMLGISPQIGRNFVASENEQGKSNVVILTDAFWRSEFHADPGVLGRVINLDGKACTVVGVMPASFHFLHGVSLGPLMGMGNPAPPQVLEPIVANSTSPVGNFNVLAIARMKPGVTTTRLRTELDVIEARMLANAHATNQLPASIQVTVNTVVTPLRDQIVGDHGLGLWLLLAAVGAILLIVCLNLANLLLVRVYGRSHELAIRVALGAGRGRLLRETVAEGIVLAILGGILGCVAAWAALRWLVHAAPAGIPRLGEVGLNWQVLVFALVLAVACGVLFSLWPALRSAGADPQSALRSGGRGSSDSGHRLRTRSWLVGAQAALAALLLIVAGLLIASYSSLLGVNKGFQLRNVVTANVTWPGNFSQRVGFYRSMIARLQALPGVQEAGIIDTIPTQGSSNTDILSHVNDTRPIVDRPLANYYDVSPDYFRAMSIPLQRGHTFTAAEMALALKIAMAPKPKKGVQPPPLPPIPALISTYTAAEVWPGKNPIGQQFQQSDPSNGTFQVVGVVGDVRSQGLDKAPSLQVYLPYTSRVPGGVAVALQTNAPLAALAPAIRTAVWSVQPKAAVDQIETMQDVVAASVSARHFQMMLVLAFALCALFLAGLGIYGVIAYSVERRAPEIGIRMTMGASAGDLVRMVMRQGLTPVVAGLIVGIAVALASGKLLASLLFGVHAGDVSVIVGVCVVLLAVALLACALPAHRATRISPLRVLRD